MLLQIFWQIISSSVLLSFERSQDSYTCVVCSLLLWNEASRQGRLCKGRQWWWWFCWYNGRYTCV